MVASWANNLCIVIPRVYNRKCHSIYSASKTVVVGCVLYLVHVPNVLTSKDDLFSDFAILISGSSNGG